MKEIKPDWKKLTNFQRIRLFIPTSDKIKKITQELMDTRWNLSDEYRNQYAIEKLLLTYFSSPSHMFYEIGDFGGILGFAYIIASHKCELLCKIWDKEIWTHNTIKEVKQLINTIMEEFQLIRIGTETPDLRMKDIATRFLGFKEEGIRTHDFKWQGEFYDNYLLAKTREE